MGKDIGHFYKHILSKKSPPTLKKPVLLSSASHTLSASNSAKTYILSRLDHKPITNNQNKNNISNTDDIQSYITPKQNYSVQATYSPTHLTPLNATLHITSIKFHTTTKLPPASK